MQLTSPHAEKSRILVVDDDVLLGKSLSRHLATAGFSPHLATSGAEAETYLVDHQVDTLLIDIVMPNLDGFGLLRRLRARYVRTPVILMTASPSAELAFAALDEGATAYLVKPIERDRLLDVTEAAVNSLRVLDDADASPSRRAAKSRSDVASGSEHFGLCYTPDGERYSLHYYGGTLRVAVVVGPIPRVYCRVAKVPEAHREPAIDAVDAWAKLIAWCKSKRVAPPSGSLRRCET